MNLQGQIELISVPQEFTRLCNAVLYAEYHDDFLAIDDDRPDRGNDGYVKSEHRIFAMHCFKRLQNQRLENEIVDKMASDLAKAIKLKVEGRWRVDSWTFLTNYPISESIAAKIVAAGTAAGVDVSWRGPQYIADVLQRYPEICEQFPNLQINQVSEQLRSLTDQIEHASGELSLDLDQVGVPRNSTEQDRLLTQRPPGWEYLLLAGVMLQLLQKLNPKIQDHEIRYSAPQISKNFLTLRDALDYISSATRRAGKITNSLMRVFDEEVQLRTFGPPGEPGDPNRISHLATRIVGSAEELIEWAADLRSIQVPRQLEQSIELTAQLVDQPIRDILDFVNSYIAQAEQIPELLAQPHEKPIRLSLTLTLTVDEEVTNRCNHELEHIARSLRSGRNGAQI